MKAILVIIGLLVLAVVLVSGCPQSGQCSDSDGGQNYYELGLVENALTGQMAADYCLDDFVLVEFYCDLLTNEPVSEEYECHKENLHCVDGACVQLV